MKKLIKILLLFCVVNGFAQQNLVPNPSFEDTAIGCPDNSGQINRAKFWFNINGSSDYFNRCYNGPSNYNSIPNNSFTYQEVNTLGCNAYAGIFTAAPGFNNINEIFGVKLTDSLIIGTKYYFSIKVAASNLTKYASNNIGALLSKYHPPATGLAAPNNFCQINFPQVITDTLNWTKLFTSFVADSNYKFLRIGNFKDSSLTVKTLINNSSLAGSRAYYTLDDICLSTDSIFAFNYNYYCLTTDIDNIKNAVQKNSFHPNPAKDYIFINNSNYLGGIISIFDINQSLKLTSIIENLNLNVNELNSGVYIVNIKKDNLNIRQKLIIQKIN